MKIKVEKPKIIRDYILRYGHRVVKSKIFKASFHQKHHLMTSVGRHTVQVAVVAIFICGKLKKHGIEVDEQVVVRAALMHDLGMMGRKERYRNNFVCSQRHPAESVVEAMKIYPDLDKKTRDAIRTHMWPVTPLYPPRSIEGVVVTCADKWAALLDILPDWLFKG